MDHSASAGISRFHPLHPKLTKVYPSIVMRKSPTSLYFPARRISSRNYLQTAVDSRTASPATRFIVTVLASKDCLHASSVGPARQIRATRSGERFLGTTSQRGM